MRPILVRPMLVRPMLERRIRARRAHNRRLRTHGREDRPQPLAHRRGDRRIDRGSLARLARILRHVVEFASRPRKVSFRGRVVVVPDQLPVTEAQRAALKALGAVEEAVG